MHLSLALALAAALGAAESGPAARPAEGGDLDAVHARGVLRHLGVRYAAFVTGMGDGLDVELMRRFAEDLGVRYEFVESEWATVLPDLTGRRISSTQTDLALAARAPVRGDIVASGLTILPWREKVVSFSRPVFPTQVWVVARADSTVQPITPAGSLEKDVTAVKALLRGRKTLAVANTCLEPSLYQLDRTGANVQIVKLRIDEVAPALIQGAGELALLDMPDAVIALHKWPGQLKVIGPISANQEMAVAFRLDSPNLRQAFDAFLARARQDGTYEHLVKTYFPEVPTYFRSFFVGVR
jgi:ABC-type amino acid transport substrate-binding protein